MEAKKKQQAKQKHVVVNIARKTSRDHSEYDITKNIYITNNKSINKTNRKATAKLSAFREKMIVSCRAKKKKKEEN